jgi:hypothetical protein
MTLTVDAKDSLGEAYEYEVSEVFIVDRTPTGRCSWCGGT